MHEDIVGRTKTASVGPHVAVYSRGAANGNFLIRCLPCDIVTPDKKISPFFATRL